VNEETRKKLKRTLAQLDQRLTELLEGVQSGSFPPNRISIELVFISTYAADLRRTIDAATPC
jgi:hypothetical protein